MALARLCSGQQIPEGAGWAMSWPANAVHVITVLAGPGWGGKCGAAGAARESTRRNCSAVGAARSKNVQPPPRSALLCLALLCSALF
eukprot:gene18768-biopygen18992